MRLITQSTDYAIRILCSMAKRKSSTVTAKELSAELNISWPLVRRILGELGKKGLVRSSKGRGGGFNLEATAERIYIMELIDIFQGFLKLNKCSVKGKVCSNIESCALRLKIRAIEKKVLDELSTITIESLIDEELVDNEVVITT
jgi:Rrf2 family protein